MKSNSINSLDEQQTDETTLSNNEDESIEEGDENECNYDEDLQGDDDCNNSSSSSSMLLKNVNNATAKKICHMRRTVKLNSNAMCRKRKCRTTFSKFQLNALEAEFLKSSFVSNDRIDSLIDITGLDSRIIKV